MKIKEKQTKFFFDFQIFSFYLKARNNKKAEENFSTNLITLLFPSTFSLQKTREIKREYDGMG